MWQFDGSRHFMQMVGSFVFFQWLNRYLTPQLSQYLPSYNNVAPEKKMEWHARTVSSVHAVLVSAVCIYIITSDEESKKNMLWGESWIGKSNIAVATGYLISDLFMLFINHENSDMAWGFIGHHLSALYAYYYVLVYGVLVYFANFRLLAEISTPFVNLRWFYDVSGKRTSEGYFINGLFMTSSFFLCRIVTMPYYYYLVYSTFGSEDFHKLGFAIQVAWVVSCILLDIQNIIWFIKMLRGAQKVLHLRKAKREQNGNCSTHEGSKSLNNNTELINGKAVIERPKVE